METETPSSSTTITAAASATPTVVPSPPMENTASSKEGYTFLPPEAQTSKYVSYLTCGVCFDFVRDPKYHVGCKVLFCSECLEKSIETSHGCPICRKSSPGSALQKTQIVPCSTLDKQCLNDLMVRCNRCEAVMSLEAYDTHNQKQCPRPCPYGCAGVLTMLQFNESHEAVCPFRPIACQYARLRCPWTGNAQELARHLGSHDDAESSAASCGYMKLARLLEQATKLQWVLAQERRPWIKAVQQKIDCLDMSDQRWYLAKILEFEQTPSGVRVYITFVEYASMWNEWIDFDSPRLQPLGTHTSAHRSGTASQRARNSSTHFGSRIPPHSSSSSSSSTPAVPHPGSTGARRILLYGPHSTETPVAGHSGAPDVANGSNSTGSSSSGNPNPNTGTTTTTTTIHLSSDDPLANGIPLNFRFPVGLNQASPLHNAIMEALTGAIPHHTSMSD